MDDPKSLDIIFTKKLFRIPDYQRGFAWQIDQLRDFWEDLINLSDDRSHYVGVLTLKEIDSSNFEGSKNEFWLIDDHSYTMYDIVDGQQRLTTFVIFLQAFVEFIMQLDEYKGKNEADILITDSLDLKTIIEEYLYRKQPTKLYRTYKFGYAVDTPSDKCLRHRIFNEPGGGEIENNFYTLNLRNAKKFFYDRFGELNSDSELKGLQKIYKNLTKRFHLNVYVIKDDFDVFVAFETMNNRGKKLSVLELLKNRLIYLTTLYSENDLKKSDYIELRDSINRAWGEIYKQLGRNEKHPLNDDDFLKAHWIIYFTYSRKVAKEYVKFLLGKRFTPQSVHEKTERSVELNLPEEQRTDFHDSDDDLDDLPEMTADSSVARLTPEEIRDYVDSLKESAVHWFNSHFPNQASEMNKAEQDAIEQLNRIGMGYFRILVMAILKNEPCESERIDAFEQIERFIFIVFRLCQSNRNYQETVFCKAARKFDRGELTLDEIKETLRESSSFCFYKKDILNSNYFRDYLYKKFYSGDKSGYYRWNGLKFFLYEYELSLRAKSIQQKISWDDLLKSEKDKISIEHIMPQTIDDNWKKIMIGCPQNEHHLYIGSLGNLLLLSMSINSSLQNHSFENKKKGKIDRFGKKIRHGYSDGSHSEIKVAKYKYWGRKTIRQRGMDLLNFMEERWDFKFKNNTERSNLLILKSRDDE